MKLNKIYLEDCKLTMQKMEENSITHIICDPPYFLEFMSKTWDSDHKKMEGENDGQKMYKWHLEWVKEAYRILKPGGYLVAFGGCRTSHRLACAMEDVGFEIRDQIAWVFSQGFPKSFNISKGIDKKFGKSGKVIGKRIHPTKDEWDMTKSITPEAQKWEGWGTGLKPAYEPILIGMKKIDKNFVNNALIHGVAGINIDAGRIKTNNKLGGGSLNSQSNGVYDIDGFSRPWMKDKKKREEHSEKMKKHVEKAEQLGRFPANLILSHHPECELIGEKIVKNAASKKFHNEYESKSNTGFLQGHSHPANQYAEEIVEVWNCHSDCPIKIMNKQSGERKTTWVSPKHQNNRKGEFLGSMNHPGQQGYNDSGGASRFFYCAKPSTNERNLGLYRSDGIQHNYIENNNIPEIKNDHPTLKPIYLLRYLVSIFSTPDGGIVYDPFTGSGTTLIACKILDIPYIGSEIDDGYYKIAKKRLEYDWKNWWKNNKKNNFIKTKEKIKNKFF